MTAALRLTSSRLRAHSPLLRRDSGKMARDVARHRRAEILALRELYARDIERWIYDCVQIQTHDDAGAPWAPLRLWPAQAEVVRTLHTSKRHLVLKARQLGLTWLALVVALHRMIFRPGSKVLVLSLREEEAVAALRRLAGIYKRLPAWQRAAKALRGLDSGGALTLSTGSEAIALPSHRGDSYTAAVVIVDEASLIPDLGQLLASVEPTVGDSGQIWLISRANKQDPLGTFARLCSEALSGQSSWALTFLPWHARPDRDQAWYEAKAQASIDIDGTLDTLHGQYPATPQEALAPSTGDRRIPAAWLIPCVEIAPPRLGSAPGVEVLHLPVPGRRYVIGADPAEGLAHGDDSAASVVDVETGQEMAAAAGKWEPKHVFPQLLQELHALYNAAPIYVERNNHGHATIGALQVAGVPLVDGPDGAPGLAKSPASKARTWSEVGAELAARAKVRTPEHLEAARLEGHRLPAPLICSARTARQVGLIEASTCKAPPGEHDDLADAWALAQSARTRYASAWLDTLLTNARTS